MNELQEWFSSQNIDLKTINLGGGLGIDYNNPDKMPEFDEYFTLIRELVRIRPVSYTHLDVYKRQPYIYLLTYLFKNTRKIRSLSRFIVRFRHCMDFFRQYFPEKIFVAISGKKFKKLILLPGAQPVFNITRCV